MIKCKAKSKRTELRCKNWAIRGKNVCRFHGGCSIGPKTAQGRESVRKAHYKHGGYMKKTIAENNLMRKLLKKSRRVLEKFY